VQRSFRHRCNRKTIAFDSIAICCEHWHTLQKKFLASRAVAAPLAERCHGVPPICAATATHRCPKPPQSHQLQQSQRPFPGPIGQGKIDPLAPNGAHGLDNNRCPGVHRG
jgi:hypothetical protein